MYSQCQPGGLEFVPVNTYSIRRKLKGSNPNNDLNKPQHSISTVLYLDSEAINVWLYAVI